MVVVVLRELTFQLLHQAADTLWRIRRQQQMDVIGRDTIRQNRSRKRAYRLS